MYRSDVLNFYAYVGNNTVNYVDPSGYVCERKAELYKKIRKENPEMTASDAKKAVDEYVKKHPYGELDSLKRPTGINASITQNMIGTGSSASSSIKPPGFLGGGAGHARGHLLGRQLDGSGKDHRNLVTLYQNPVNIPVMSSFESQVRKAVEAGETINYSATPIYKGNKLIPSGVTLSAEGNRGFKLYVTILNRK